MCNSNRSPQYGRTVLETGQPGTCMASNINSGSFLCGIHSVSAGGKFRPFSIFLQLTCSYSSHHPLLLNLYPSFSSALSPSSPLLPSTFSIPSPLFVPLSQTPSEWRKYELSPAQVEQFWEEGYLSRIPVLTEEQCDKLLQDYALFLVGVNLSSMTSNHSINHTFLYSYH